MSDAINAVLAEYHRQSHGYDYHEVLSMAEEIVRLRAAIDRVRALHERETRTACFGSIVWHLCPHCRDDDGYLLEHPCPTLRALDGEGA